MTRPPLVGRYRLLSVVVAVHLDDAVVRDAVANVLSPFRWSGSGGRALVVEQGEEGFVATLDGAPFFRARDQRECVTFLVWRLNELVAEAPDDRLLVHASVACRDGRALLFPGGSGAGKSTLAAALVRAGLGYLSDELAPIPIGSAVVEPYPRAITLEQGVWAAFADLEERGAVVRATDQWFVPPQGLRPGCIEDGPRPILAVIFPRAEPGAATSLTELARAEALMRLARNTVNLAAHAGHGFRTLSAIIRDVPICAELVSGSVDDAVAAVLGSTIERVGQRGT